MSDPARADLSIVIASFQCRDLLAACLESLDGERSMLRLDVIVVDNASTDGTAGHVRDVFPWVNLLEAGGNLGFAVASNVGIRAAEAEFVLLLNPDTVVSLGSLKGAVDELESRAEVGMLGVKLVQPDGRLDHACKRGFPKPMSALYHFMGLSRRWPTSPRFAQYTAGHVADDEIAEVDAVNGAFMLIRKDALADVGLLDEEYWLYMEDLDWCYRFWRAGWKVLYWPRVSITHAKGGSSGTSRSWRANHAFHRGMWLFYRKHYASRHRAAWNGLIWVAIYLKLMTSAAVSWTRRQMRPLLGPGTRALPRPGS